MNDRAKNFIERKGHHIAFTTYGDKSDLPLVICHGLAANGTQFISDAEYFAQQGFYVIVPDLRGHGQSQLLVDPNLLEFSIPELASDVIAVLDHMGLDQVHFVGNSLGGVIGLQLMGEHSNRLATFASFGTAYALNSSPIAIWLLPRMLKLLGSRIVAAMGAKSTSDNPDVQAIVHKIYAESNLQVVARISAEIGKYDLIDNAIAFKKPLLMLRGAKDKTVNSELGPTLERMHALENFKLVEIENAGHCANLDAPDLVRSELLKHFAKA
ncbi:alpha/beta fold hydrolase [Maritalea porphyrae]|uniref:AB hydrolase-1 domain-containing protein n=1 Tax=Maritalea porphyrae TaxID=880732 RepID=A0ABQ5USI5_9HYPH|nr:alpha/beta hydrolase [Maritalea porphyrae]GLQ17285.1 hypothetical protein GCM10007879_15340 [Maritalea porphyrae]